MWSPLKSATRSQSCLRSFYLSRTMPSQVIVKCLEQHGESWLHPPVVQVSAHLVSALHFCDFELLEDSRLSPFESVTRSRMQGFRELFEQGGCGHVRVHSIEVWKDGVLVAGELGYSVGAMYTSLSGFTCLDSSGTVQIVSLGLILHEHGFDCWDLGMGMDYKQSMGAKNVHRLRFLEKLRAVRERSVKELGMAATPARDILAPKLPIGRLVHLDVSKATGPGVQGRQPGGSDPSASAGEVIGMVVGVRGVELKIRLEPGDKGLAFARLQALRELGGKGDAGGTGMSGELPRSLSGLGAGGGRKGRAKRRKKMTPRVAGAAQEHGDGDGATLRGGGGGSAALESGAMDVDAGGIPTADQLAHHRAWERACALRVAARGYLARALRERQSAGGLSKRATRRLRKLMSREGKLTLRKLGTA